MAQFSKRKSYFSRVYTGYVKLFPRNKRHSRCFILLLLITICIFFLSDFILENYSPKLRSLKEVYTYLDYKGINYGDEHKIKLTTGLDTASELMDEFKTLELNRKRKEQQKKWPYRALQILQGNRLIGSENDDDVKKQIVFGIPTIQRDGPFYLSDTLKSLFNNLSPEIQDKVLIVIYVGNFDNEEYVDKVIDLVVNDFEDYLQAGIIQVIRAPPETIFPTLDVTQLKNLFKHDSDKRLYWRSKQNLDFALLMAYCKDKGDYYVQLEDDIITVPKYVETMLNYIQETATRHEQWFLINFCHLGFIGKAFPTKQLNGLYHYFTRKYDLYPVDILLPMYISQKNKQAYTRKIALFQHVGFQSSLSNKIQSLVDGTFLDTNIKQNIDNDF